MKRNAARSMIGILALLLLLPLVCLTGCHRSASNIAIGTATIEGDVLSLDKRIITNDQLLKWRVNILDVKARREGGYIVAQVVLKNNRKRTFSGEYLFEWFDNEGFKIDSPVEHWAPVVIHGEEEKHLQSTAPSPRAVTFKLHFRRPYPVRY
jgi:uncharacterized protein YcfL